VQGGGKVITDCVCLSVLMLPTGQQVTRGQENDQTFLLMAFLAFVLALKNQRNSRS